MSHPPHTSSTDELKKRFSALWNRCASDEMDSSPEDAWQELVRHYTESHRYYHVLAHLAYCMKWHEHSAAGMKEPDAVEMALWYHDIIYETRHKDNEQRSAQLFRLQAADCFPQAFIDRVCGYIINTDHGACPADQDAAYVQDIDLSSLGLPWAEFLRDSNNIRQEFSSLPDIDYYTANHGFLASLLRRERIYFTDFFHRLLEQAARANIGRYLNRLEDQGLIRDHKRPASTEQPQVDLP